MKAYDLKYKQLEPYFSSPRMQKYLIAANHNYELALKHYKRNLEISQSFYPLLHLFEIILRNMINSELSLFFKDTNWILNQQNEFMSHKSLKKNHYYLKTCIKMSEAKLKRNNKTINANQILSEQSLSFWVGFFDAHHFKLIHGCPIHIFKNKPRNVNRKLINSKLNRIRKFRNRIYHNEPICFAGKNISYHHAQQIEVEIYEIFDWIHPELNKQLEAFVSPMK